MTTIFSNYNNSEQSNSFKNIKSPSLSHGTKFKKYQNKIKKKSKQNSHDNVIESFENEIVSTDEPIPSTDPTINILTTESKEIIENNTEVDQTVKIEELRKEYDIALNQYQDLMDKINNTSEEYLQRTRNNPYAGKNIRFSTGHVCYVTHQGVVKHIPNPTIWDSLVDKNGCPGRNYTDVGIPYNGNIGDTIPELNLIYGPPMTNGESCGNAGKNVFVNRLLNNPKEKYRGCFNDVEPVTEVMMVPVMNSNSMSGFTARASSVFQGNNGVWGPWTAFNRRDDPYWHSEGVSYDTNTGNFTGRSNWTYRNSSGQNVTVNGEWLWIEMSRGLPLTKYELKGRQGCCGDPNGRTPNSWIIIGGVYNQPYELVDQKENQQISYEMRTYHVRNSKAYNHYIFLTTNVGHPQNKTHHRNSVQISQWNLYTSSNFVTSVNRAMIWEPEWIGYEELETCKKYASENGFKYFALQDGRTTTSTAACLVSNDLAKIEQYGRAYAYKPIALWSTSTNNRGTVALLNNSCSLVVNNSSGAAVWSSPNNTGLVSNYFGCYNDCSQGRGLPTHTGWANIDTCRDMAVRNNANFYGLQWTQSNNLSECWIGNDIERARMMGKASNCRKVNGQMVGGGCSNAVYATNFNASTVISSFLILQDDGNMVIYRGTGPNDNQGGIWSTSTHGKQKQPNSNFKASKSKFGRNWISNGTTLAAGDWIGSNNGSIYLIMQSDGNLVLYTNERTDACFTNSKKQLVGGGWVNAVYELQNSGYKENVGKLAYINENDVLHEYNKDNSKLTTNYTKVSRFDAWGDDIPGAAYGNASQQQCQSSCDGRNECYGFVYDFNNKVCYPKTSGMWPYGGRSRPLHFTDTYIRNKEPNSPPIGVTNETINIDSAQYQFYNKGGPPDLKYGLSIATEEQQAELKKIEEKMIGLTNQINSLINADTSNTNITENQAERNLKGLNNYQKDYRKISENIHKLNSINNTSKESFTNYGYSANNNNINKIVQDSDIIVLQKNYEYLLWTILATGSVIVAMNISKK